MSPGKVSAMIDIVAIDGIHEDGLNVIRRHPRLRLTHYIKDGNREGIREAMADAHGILVGLSRLDKDVLDLASNLEIVARIGVGYDNIDVTYLTQRGIYLFLTGDTNSTSVAEHALYMLLELAKHGRRYDRAVRDGNWIARKSYESVELAGRMALVVGFGRIGRAVARLFDAIGMRIAVSDECLDREAAAKLGYEPVGDFRTVLGDADVVTVHVPLTPATSGLIGASELAAMKDSAFVLNLSRGGIVDEHALSLALTRGLIAGAGLDVFAFEPLPLDHSLLNAPNLILSPHSAGLTAEGAARTAVAAAANIVDFYEGHPKTERIVNPEVLSSPGLHPK